MSKPADGLLVTTNDLERAIRTMKPHQRLYELIKAEMKRRRRWKNNDRGAKPPKAGQNL